MTQSPVEYFGQNVFNDQTMRDTLPKDTYRELKKTIDDGLPLNRKIANAVAHAMKIWAAERGVTHYTHWFQPLNGNTAEKHDAFLVPGEHDTVLMEFSGKELIKGEPDASSFPNGGIRSTFEARGYTTWDPTSPAFIKDGVLCIPTAFCSYTGAALDEKTPLLRSMEAVSTQTMRALHLLGNTDVKRVRTTVGAEQEYFLVDKDVYLQRRDLRYTGRTLFGATCPKGQEMEDHYFGTIKSRVHGFMKELDEELWKLGVISKTEHNEVAPAQHEMAPLFTTTNLAADQNQLAMELIQRIAKKHGMVALLHEKPFEGINGSGKHNNWSISTDTGENLLEPGDTPAQNLQFLFFLTAIIQAVDEHQDLLRISVASAGNDHRLGAHEAPPAVISVFVGDELQSIIDDLLMERDHEEISKTFMDTGSVVLPHLPKDSTDRNRTSPFAFTGNKFEFRMPGSSQSISSVNMMLNAAMADSLDQMCTRLEAMSDLPLEEAVHQIILSTLKDHERILFNGNGYSEEWLEEAKRRGLYNLPTTPDALAHYTDDKNLQLLEKFGILSREEVFSRKEIALEEYTNFVLIEARTMNSMARKEILPAVTHFQKELASTVHEMKEAGFESECLYQQQLLGIISPLVGKAWTQIRVLQESIDRIAPMSDGETKAFEIKDLLLPQMQALRESCDELERNTESALWPFPTYGKLLFGIL